MNVDSANRPRLQGRTAGYEVWYVTVNDAPNGRGFWFRYTTFRPAPGARAEPHAGLWAVAFDRTSPSSNVAVKKTYAVESMRFGGGSFALALPGGQLDNAGCRGRVEGTGGALSWDLRWEARAAPATFVPAVVQRLSPVFQVASQPSVTVSGTVIANDETHFTLEAARGSQQHTGGAGHALEWNWGHAGGLGGDAGAWFGGSSHRVRTRAKLHVNGTAVGLCTPAGSWGFSSPWSVLMGSGPTAVGQWRAVERDGRHELRVAVTPRLADLVGVRYDDPSGGTRACYHTELADITVRLFHRDGDASELLYEAREEAVAAFEYASEREVPGLPLLV